MLQEKNIEVVFKHDGWSPILWAACNGNEEICRLLIAKNACAPYLNKQNMDGGAEEGEESNPFRKPQDPKKFGEYTPLHWASYKGFYKVSWLLLKVGIDPLNVDQYGNTAVH